MTNSSRKIIASTATKHNIFIPLWEYNMPSSDAFALSQSGLNEFLFASVGTEANGMTLSLVSVFARRGHDPWLEAGRLAGLPKVEAIESLARSIADMPTSIWSLPAATTIAARLISLLPTKSGKSGSVPLASANVAKATRFLWIGLVLAGVVFSAIHEVGVVTTTHTSSADGSDVASFSVTPH
jgi:hypothetical protein